MTVNPFEDAGSGPSFEDDFEDASSFKKVKLIELRNRLVIMKVVKIDEENLKFQGVGRPLKPGEFQPKAYVDTVVLDGGPLNGIDVPIEYDSLWITNGPLVDSLRRSFKNGSRVLGRLRQYPTKGSVDQYRTPDAIEAAFDAKEITAIDTCWRLEPKTEADLAKAKAYAASKRSNPFG